MGLRRLSSSSYDYKPQRVEVAVNVSHSASRNPSSKRYRNPNPNPKRYLIKRSLQFGKTSGLGNFLLVLINYPDCTNYEGNKILVYEDTTLVELKQQGSIDPHFSNNLDYKSPIARFEPTAKGWDMAVKLVTLMKNSS